MLYENVVASLKVTNPLLRMKNWITTLLIISSMLCHAQTGGAASLHSSRYIFSPSGYNLPKDSIYLNWIGPLLDVQYAPTENTTVGLGTPAFFGIYATGSMSFPIHDFMTAKVGGLYGLPVLGQASFGLPYAVLTLGKPDANITLGVGYGFSTGDWAGDLNGLAINAAAYKDFGGKTGILFESWYLPELETYIAAPAFRIYTKRDRRYWNIGFMAARFSTEGYSYPILGYDTNFDGMVDVTERPSGQEGNDYSSILDYDNPILERIWNTFRFPIFSYAMYF